MAILPQTSLFSWREIEDLGDLQRLALVRRHLPDEPLMRRLEARRGRGRDDYPVRAVWNSVLAGVLYQHPSVEALRRELLRNGQLRDLCGFDPVRAAGAVPPPSAYTRFLTTLTAETEALEALFDDLVERLRTALPGFGRVLAADGKALRTHARPRPKDASPPPADGRLWEKVTRWFGYKLHLVADADYEVPVAYRVTRAWRGEAPEARRLLDALAVRHPKVLEACQAWAADKGQDDTAMIRRLWDQHRIKPVIDSKAMWKEPDATRVLPGRRRIVYDERGTLWCHCPATGQARRMAYGGFEKDRQSLKFRCPARHYGIACWGQGRCEVRGAVRVPLAVDRRLFTPLARSSYAWQRLYRKRSAVERVNSRLDVSFGFERHFIRGLQKMRLRMGLALVVMLAMAYGRVKENQPGLMRSLVGAA